MRTIAFIIAAFTVAFLTACRTPEAVVIREELKRLPEWTTVRKAAQAALAQKESTSFGWRAAMAENDTGAIYPLSRDGDRWLVRAADDYPQNRYGFVVEMEISSTGEVCRYTQLWKKKTEANQPVQRNASTGSVSNFESPARRG